MSDAATLIESLGGAARVAEGIGRPVGTVGAWKHRRSIPVEVWPALMRFASQVGVPGVSAETLLEMHTGIRVSPPSLPAVHSSVQ